MSLTLASKFFASGNQQQSLDTHYGDESGSIRKSSQVVSSFNPNDSLREWGQSNRTSGVNKKDSFLVDTRLEQLKMAEQQLLKELG